ncbi:histidine kinase [Flavobacterium granuli]|uniref:Sensor histidine kinase YesM n=1 Tax=Flavobacterium granuli TaxID=280093 RepID=A0ABU1S092_9FLAO|nr:histidine kinase [Flavobacterium granuli]MDR6844421.1 sensor histidine kinase YesM [Flavobacterium granuli]
MKKKNSKIKPINYVWFWLIWFFLNFLRWGAYFNDYKYSFKSNLLEYAIHIPFVYFNIFILVPLFVLKSKYIKYTLSLLVSLAVVYLLKTGLTYYIISENIWPEANRDYRPFEINHIVAVTIGEIYVLAIASSFYYLLTWLRERDRNKAIMENQIKIKLKYLKNQIQPHFFFNTLNNLYALSLESSNKVPDVIIKLSNLMEYVLYDIDDTKFVPLIKEIDYIQNYIEIEKLRFQNVEVAINLESNIDNIKVPPLLFITLIENAFKHGGLNNGKLKMKINFRIVNSKLEFEIINNFVISPPLKSKKGIGLSNTKKRLKLIYKNDFSIKQMIKFNFFIIKMQIPLYNED